ncbi:MAG TPA: tripartite tricarboxylate transporter substrate-binding protein [Alphaproteobacteria bacterium]|jgi:tripartite-type tricarboxylate transporter receptor subunit TctC
MKLTALPTFVGLGALALGALSAPAEAQDFYRGKRIEIVVGFSAGGGYDLAARLYARHYGKQIPGNPGFLVTNMPGAGSMVAANTIYNLQPQDGTRLGMITGGIILAPILGDAQAKFDSRKFQYIGGRAAEPSVCVVWHTVPVDSMEDVIKRETIVGSSGPGSRTFTFPKALNALIGTKWKTVVGYPGGNETAAAMEKGETEAFCGWAWGTIKARNADWVRDGKIKFLTQFTLAKAPDLPNVPMAHEFAKTDEARQAIEFLESDAMLAWPFFAPPGTPIDRVQQLRASFEAMMKDPEFMADAAKQKLDIDIVKGTEMQDLVAHLYDTPVPVLKTVNDILKMQ